MGATRTITIEVSEEAASVLEADPERARVLVEIATSMPPEEVRARARRRLLDLLADPDRSSLTEEEVAAELAIWNAEGRS